jgi:hypothetical protein
MEEHRLSQSGGCFSRDIRYRCRTEDGIRGAKQCGALLDEMADHH